MLTIPHLLTTARRFVDGVCAIPEMSRLLPNVTDALNGWRGARESELAGEVLKRIHEVDDAKQITELVRSSRDEYMRKWRNEEQAHAVLTQQLTAEREAHDETRTAYRYEHENGVGLTKEIYALKSELSAARADLEALTAWRPQGVDYLPADVRALCATRNGDEYRHTPESLAAWKAREGAER